MQFGHFLAGETVTFLEPDHQRAVDQIITISQSPNLGFARRANRTRQRLQRLPRFRTTDPENGNPSTTGRGCFRKNRVQTILLQRQAFIESKNSPLVFVCFSFEIRNSIASVVPIGFRMRRST